MPFPDTLRMLREKMGVSQTRIAKELGISQQRYNHYENGKREPDYKTLVQIADYFGVNSDYLISENPGELVGFDMPADISNKIKSVAKRDNISRIDALIKILEAFGTNNYDDLKAMNPEQVKSVVATYDRPMTQSEAIQLFIKRAVAAYEAEHGEIRVQGDE